MSSKRVINIEFVFENCDYLDIDSKYIGMIRINEIYESIRRTACNCIEKYKGTNLFFIEIFKSGNTLFKSFEKDESKETKFERLANFNDITSIVITFSDDSKEEYYVDYNGAYCEESNVNQSSMISDIGNLYILITNPEKFSSVENYIRHAICSNIHKDDQFNKLMNDKEYDELRQIGLE